jgi:Cys-tRNA(Pro)/Cys-tRNA(Cys) deacylase
VAIIVAQAKTNAMRILEAKRVAYQSYTYDNKDGKIDGLSVAEKIAKDPKIVFKTLVAQATSKSIYVFVIPVGAELDLKKAAKVSSEKKLDLLPVKDILSNTGYIRGGCSPIGMKKPYRTFIDDSANQLDSIIVSGGKIGLQLELALESLMDLTRATLHPLVK